MKYLITGASGLIGGALLRELVANQHDVVAVSRHPPVGAQDVVWHKGDITKPESLAPAFSESYDVLIHLAGLVSADGRNREELFAVNGQGTRNVFEWALKAKIRRCLQVSSTAAIGPAPYGRIADETTPFSWSPDKFAYHASKHEGEKIALEYVLKGLDVVVVNPAFVYSEKDDHTPARDLLRKIRDRRLPLYPPGGMCNVWVGDVVKGMTRAVERGRTGERYILGGENLLHRDSYGIMAEALGAVIPRIPVGVAALYVYALTSEIGARLMRQKPRFCLSWARASNHTYFYSSEKAARELAYAPLDFRSTIQRVVPAMLNARLL
ncbi:MAG TPA: NAD-dependent epimerase/dehydratase family protein [Bdellovibrionota bacterium]|nr:NAD-dependent epimerase/dehydratase family protein [Bdellovibrionota bacterium]